MRGETERVRKCGTGLLSAALVALPIAAGLAELRVPHLGSTSLQSVQERARKKLIGIKKTPARTTPARIARSGTPAEPEEIDVFPIVLAAPTN